MNTIQIFHDNYYLVESVEKAIDYRLLHEEQVNEHHSILEYILESESEFFEEEPLDSRPLYTIYRKSDDKKVEMNITYEALEQFIEDLG